MWKQGGGRWQVQFVFIYEEDMIKKTFPGPNLKKKKNL